METVITFPDHVIEEILLRLPVKHLLRWKCVSKYWYARIWDIDFVKKHYLFHNDKHLADHGDVPLLLVSPSSGPQPTQFHLLLRDGVRYPVENITAEFERDTAHVFTRVPEMLDYEPRCRGVVNGVVCLQQGPNQVALWNPTTREIKDVPVCPIVTDYEEAKVYFHIDGFGFDLQSNDFKLMGQIDTWTLNNRSDTTTEFHLYSLKADSWKKIQGPSRTNICLIGSTTDAYFNSGVYYWTAFVRGELMCPSRFVSFNFSTEIFKEFELPAVAETWVGCHLRIGKYKERLALLVERALGNLERCFEIWAVTKLRDDDNEVPSSWQLIVKGPPFCVVNCLWMGGMLNCCDILLNILRHVTYAVVEGDGSFPTFGAHIYNPSTHTFYYLGFRLSSGHQYVESLFPISRTPRRPDFINMAS